MRGRKPKPTALKILEGAQPCRINRHEPSVPPPADLAPPRWLEGQAVDHWHELAPMLHRSGLLTEADRHSLALLCEAFGRFRADPTDERARDLYRRMAVEFGLTPSSRSRLRAPAEPKPDALAAFLARKNRA